MECSLAIKRNEALTPAMMWINLKMFCTVKGARLEKSHVTQIYLYEMFSLDESVETGSGVVLPRGLEEGEG